MDTAAFFGVDFGYLPSHVGKDIGLLPSFDEAGIYDAFRKILISGCKNLDLVAPKISSAPSSAC